jgi:serine/threonine protein phosphatase PrpC
VREGLLAWDGTVVRLREKVYTVVFEKVGRVAKAVAEKVKAVVKRKVEDALTGGGSDNITIVVGRPVPK